MFVIWTCIILNNFDFIFIFSPKLNGLYAVPYASFESNTVPLLDFRRNVRARSFVHYTHGSEWPTVSTPDTKIVIDDPIDETKLKIWNMVDLHTKQYEFLRTINRT